MIIYPQAEPFFINGSKETACLLLHGLTASPSEMLPVARLVHEINGCTISAPLLPGHGSQPAHLNQTGWNDWYAAAEQELNHLLDNYRRVFVAGLSMGALLSLHAASSLPGLKGAIAINAPLFTNRPMLVASAPLMRYIKPYYPKKSSKKHRELEEQGRFAYGVIPVKAFMSMSRLSVVVKEELEKITIPLLLFQSCLDESINPKGAAFIKEKTQGTSLKFIELQNSDHIATMGKEKNIIAQEITDFMDNIR